MHDDREGVRRGATFRGEGGSVKRVISNFVR
jgi:hypothetical protein